MRFICWRGGRGGQMGGRTVRDMMLRGNTFAVCGNTIDPMNRSIKVDEPVHESIRIEGNTLTGAGVTAKSVRGLTITDNRVTEGKLAVHITACRQVKIDS